MTPEEMLRHAEYLILRYGKDIEQLTIWESLEPFIPSALEAKQVAEQIHDLIRSAVVTVVFPEKEFS